VEAVKRGEGQTAMQYALEYSKSLGMWCVDEGSHEGDIRLNNEATGEVMDLARDGTVTKSASPCPCRKLSFFLVSKCE